MFHDALVPFAERRIISMSLKEKVLFIGLGNYGCKQGKAFFDMGYKIIFANKNKQDLKVLGNVPNIYRLNHFDGLGGHRELGIDLLTLLKVWEAVITKDYFWVKYNNELDKTDDIEIGDDENGLLFIYFYWSNGKHLVLYLKDYGKTYALTKRELEQNE